jgi:HprK-related kinase A
MRLGELDPARLDALAAHGIAYRIGPFAVRLTCRHRPLLKLLQEFYPAAPLLTEEHLSDFHLALRRPLSARRWLRPQIDFLIDGMRPFEPYPLDQALPLLEWGLNWCIAKRAHQYLMLHAAVVARGGRALILPGPPGSGKSTLCAALLQQGWRLLSDEFGLLDPAHGILHALPKAIPLKNTAIEVIRQACPTLRLGPLFAGTRKGDVAHVIPPPASLLHQERPARPAWVLFPRYLPGSEADLTPVGRDLTFARLTHNAFNYHLMGENGFLATAQLTARCTCHALSYPNLQQALEGVEQLCGDRHAGSNRSVPPPFLTPLPNPLPLRERGFEEGD